MTSRASMHGELNLRSPKEGCLSLVLMKIRKPFKLISYYK